MQYTVIERQEVVTMTGTAYAVILSPNEPSQAPGYGTAVAPINVRIGGMTAAEATGLTVGAVVTVAATLVP
jgi:hypothetical protein